MSGARPFTESEKNLILEAWDGEYALRNKVLFVTRLYTGLRISEALSIKVSDIIFHNEIVEYLSLRRKDTKGKREGKSVKLNKKLRDILALYLSSLPPEQEFLFASKKSKVLDSKSVWKIEMKCFEKCGLDTRQLSTHSCRKYYAERMYLLLEKDLLKTKEALGHKEISSTVRYINVNKNEIANAVEML